MTDQPTDQQTDQQTGAQAAPVPSLWSRVKAVPGVVRHVISGKGVGAPLNDLLAKNARQIDQMESGEKSYGAEGSWRGPFYGQSGYGDSGNWHQLGPLDIGWQRNLEVSPHDAALFGPVYACVAILAQELSRIDIQHVRIEDDGKRTIVTNKAPARIFRKPNHYQTKMDWLMYIARSLLLDGNGYAIASRNDRNEVDALYPVTSRNFWPYIHDGEVYYNFSDQDVADLTVDNFEEGQWFHQRDVFHIRLFCPRHPLIGESPIKAALLPATTGMQINRQTATFFQNMSRPSGILRYPGKLGATAPLQETAIKRIKQRFMELTQQQHQGEPLVLQENGDWKPLTMSAVEAELIKSYNLTERQIAQVYRIPPFLLGDLEKASFQNVESLSRFFVSSALGYHVQNFEDALTAFFNLPPNEMIKFNVEAALLRGDLESRMASYAKGIQSGILSPNEARAREYLPPVEDGEQPRVQQQLVPLSYGMAIQPPTPGGQPPADPPEDPPEDDPETEEQKLAACIIAKRAIEKAMAA